jgi:hypothetical protein
MHHRPIFTLPPGTYTLEDLQQMRPPLPVARCKCCQRRDHSAHEMGLCRRCRNTIGQGGRP